MLGRGLQVLGQHAPLLHGASVLQAFRFGIFSLISRRVGERFALRSILF